MSIIEPMTYGQFLLLFLILPIFGLYGWMITRGELTRKRLFILASLAGLALLYTSPWDNYLVASRVWWYYPDQVWQIVIGWVPLEEYLFFILQPLLVGVGTMLVAHRKAATVHSAESARTWVWKLLTPIWLMSLLLFCMSLIDPGLHGWRYMSLILGWLLIPVMFQLWFGADILIRRWRGVVSALTLSTLYFSIADTIAIAQRTWVINDQYVWGWDVAGYLPVEEFIFFLVTNMLIVFGVVLFTAPESIDRARQLFGERVMSLVPSILFDRK